MKPVKTRLKSFLLFAAGLLLTSSLLGCLPKKIIWWSPDGQRALMAIGDDKQDSLLVFDAEGNLAGPIGPTLHDVAWFSDSKRILAVRNVEVSTWDEVRPALSDARQKELLDRVDALRHEILSHEGEIEGWVPRSVSDLPSSEALALWFYVREHANEGLAPKLGDEWQRLREATLTLHTFQIYNVTDTTCEPGPALGTCLHQVVQDSLRLSPDETTFIYVYMTAEPAGTKSSDGDARPGTLIGNPRPNPLNGDSRPGTLIAAETKPKAEHRVVASDVGMFPDYYPDSESVVFAQWAEPHGGSGLALGTIVRKRLRNDEGQFQPELDNREELAGSLLAPCTKIRCLTDGSIIFNAFDVHLPSTSADMPQSESLFSIAPGKRATIARITTRQAESMLPEPFALGLYEVSPDERYVSIMGQRTLMVYEIATGRQVNVLPDTWRDREPKDALPGTRQDQEPKKDLAYLPSWRPPNDLCAFVPDGSPWGGDEDGSVIIWSADRQEGRCISKTWKEQLAQATRPASSDAP